MLASTTSSTSSKTSRYTPDLLLFQRHRDSLISPPGLHYPCTCPAPSCTHSAVSMLLSSTPMHLSIHTSTPLPPPSHTHIYTHSYTHPHACTHTRTHLVYVAVCLEPLEEALCPGISVLPGIVGLGEKVTQACECMCRCVGLCVTCVCRCVYVGVGGWGRRKEEGIRHEEPTTKAAAAAADGR